MTENQGQTQKTFENTSAEEGKALNSACAEQRLNAFGEAFNIVTSKRQDQYGNPEDSFKLIADFWNAYLRKRADEYALEIKARQGPGGLPIDFLRPEDVAIMMTLFKIAREAHQHKRDNLVDAMGYLGICADRFHSGCA